MVSFCGGFNSNEGSLFGDLVGEEAEIFVDDFLGFTDEAFGKPGAGALEVVGDFDGVAESFEEFDSGNASRGVLVFRGIGGVDAAHKAIGVQFSVKAGRQFAEVGQFHACLLYTSPSPRDRG